MHVVIATVALLANATLAQAEARDFSALAQPAFTSGHREPRASRSDFDGSSAQRGGFSGSFSVRQTVKNLGY